MPYSICCMGVSAFQAATEKCIGVFLAKQEASRVNLYNASKEFNRFTQAASFWVSMTAVVPKKIEPSIRYLML